MTVELKPSLRVRDGEGLAGGACVSTGADVAIAVGSVWKICARKDSRLCGRRLGFYLKLSAVR